MKSEEQKTPYYYVYFDAIEEILNAPEADREVVARKYTFLAPYLTGKVPISSYSV